ncbi:hypothetical protein BSKO_04946 [Bryopsis sp. KO-2023]|nr:hypothetical protein BSKO_04946 [Bryopsis sp. KO-2023]
MKLASNGKGGLGVPLGRNDSSAMLFGSTTGKSAYFNRSFGRGKSGRSLPTPVSFAGPNWNESDDGLRNVILQKTRRFAPYFRDRVEPEKLVDFVQANRLGIYCAFLATLGVRVSTTLGMGWALIAACMLTTGLGYVKCIHQALMEEARKGKANADVGAVVMRAYRLAFLHYSFKTEEARDRKNKNALLLSALYEPSPVYLLLNCWGMYAVGQCAVCGSFGGGLLLLVSLASFAAGRLLQFALWKKLGQPSQMTSSSSSPSLTAEATMEPPTLMQQFSEILFTPIGTWGIGPIFNGVVWFACLALPFVQYPASPVAMAPLWTALGVPVLLLLEDIYSLFSKTRRDAKYATSMGPGLQVGSFLVGIAFAAFARNMHMVTFLFWP